MLINVDSLCFSYGKKNILENICFDVEAGQCIAILGNNGVGKSTMVKCLNKILPIKGGNVLVDGNSVLKMQQRLIAQQIAYVPQACGRSQLTVYDAILLGRKPYIKVAGSQEDYDIVNQIINRMNLHSIKLKMLDELSGGELQMVILCRALAQQPKILLLDEPTSNLDVRNQLEVMNIVREIADKKKISVIMVIHDINTSLRYCDKFLLLKDRNIFSYGDIQTVTKESVETVYGITADMIWHNDRKFFIPEEAM